MKTPKRGFIFNSVKLKKPKRNAFNLSYENKLTGNMGELLPFYVQDVLPHDTFKVGQEYLLKLQPLIAPIMHRVDVYQYYFFVPLRLLWNEWEKFITGGEDGLQTAEHPFFTASKLNGSDKDTNKLLDLLGYPVSQMYESSATGSLVAVTEKFSSLRIRAYNLVYNEFFRDQNLQEEVLCSKDSGQDTSATQNWKLLHRAWKKDYFTSALPFTQRGPNVQVPWSGGSVGLVDDSPNFPQMVIDSDDPAASGANVSFVTDGAPSRVGNFGVRVGSGDIMAKIDPNGTLKVENDLNISINDLRRASAIQRWFERNARGGARYVEQILSHFGIRPSDYRLARPMYLGGGRQPLNVGEVLQTSATIDEDSTPQSNRSGIAGSSNAQYVFKETFEEHGIILGLCCVLPRATYSQGCNRLLQKFDKFDYAQPEFSNLGEQEVLNKEIYFDTKCFQPDLTIVDSDNNKVFGYQSRYAEYKYNFDEVHGDFRTSLNYWHLGRIFADRPNLNGSFIQSVPRKDIFAVTTQEEDCLLFDFYNNVTAFRCLSAYGTPAL